MKRQKDIQIASTGAARRFASERGVALVTTLILLSLLGAASVAVALLVSSDTMINGYYRNYRGSFYAADSGVNVVVETMKNAIQAAANDANNPSLPIDGTIPASVSAAYAPYLANYYTIGDTGSWSGQFEAASVTLSAPQTLAGQATFCQVPDPTHPTDNVTCDYVYPYTVVVKGKSSGTEAEQISESGTIHYHSFSGTPGNGGPPSFAKWGAFIDDFGDCQGPLVPGTMWGPFFTNGQWNFGNNSNPGYTFMNNVGQAGNNVSWWTNSGRSPCVDAAYNQPPNGFKQPVFQGGFTPNQGELKAPADSYNQAQAVLDAKGIPPCTATPCPTDNPPSQATMSAELKTVGGTTYPSTGTPPNGVYIPTYTNSSGQQVYGSNPNNGGDGSAGGFYIQGNASVTLTSAADASNHPTQTYAITQGSTTTTIVVDTAANTTTVTSGSSTETLQGVPTQLDPNTGAPVTQTDPSGNAVSPTLIYVNGQITGLSGTVQNDSGITVAAAGDISVTGDLTYAQSPVSIPSDALNSSTDAGVLGIYTTGNINLYADSSGNLTVDASLAALSGAATGSGTSGFETPGRSQRSCGDSICTWTIVGGRSEDQAHGVSIGQGNTYYDQRFATGKFGPPWFPTAIPQAGAPSVNPNQQTTVSRTLWQELNRSGG